MGDGEDVIRRKKQPKPNIFSDEDSDGMVSFILFVSCVHYSEFLVAVISQ